MEWIQTNWTTIVEALAYVVASASVIVGMINRPGATKAAEVFGKILHFFSMVTFKNDPGSLSVPLTNLDIKPKEPTA